jgi:hypothetical protein
MYVWHVRPILWAVCVFHSFFNICSFLEINTLHLFNYSPQSACSNFHTAAHFRNTDQRLNKLGDGIYTHAVHICTQAVRIVHISTQGVRTVHICAQAVRIVHICKQAVRIVHICTHVVCIVHICTHLPTGRTQHKVHPVNNVGNKSHKTKQNLQCELCT